MEPDYFGKKRKRLRKKRGVPKFVKAGSGSQSRLYCSSPGYIAYDSANVTQVVPNKLHSQYKQKFGKLAHTNRRPRWQRIVVNDDRTKNSWKHDNNQYEVFFSMNKREEWKSLRDFEGKIPRKRRNKNKYSRSGGGESSEDEEESESEESTSTCSSQDLSEEEEGIDDGASGSSEEGEREDVLEMHPEKDRRRSDVYRIDRMVVKKLRKRYEGFKSHISWFYENDEDYKSFLRQGEKMQKLTKKKRRRLLGKLQNIKYLEEEVKRIEDAELIVNVKGFLEHSISKQFRKEKGSHYRGSKNRRYDRVKDLKAPKMKKKSDIRHHLKGYFSDKLMNKSKIGNEGAYY